MNTQTVINTIQLIIAPVVMVTACAVILNGLLTRFATINERLRSMTHERLELLRTPDSDGFAIERIAEIDEQIPRVLQRHKLGHDAVFGVYSAMVIFLGDMFVIALALFINEGWLATLALLVFLGGICAVIYGVSLTLREIFISLSSVTYEVKRVTSLKPFSLKTKKPE